MSRRFRSSNSWRKAPLKRSNGSFLDDVSFKVVAGTGGRGASSFHREKYIPNGFPDGGDGGNGGDVIVAVDPQLNSLDNFQSHSTYRAGNGGAGSRNNRHGANGPSHTLSVPPGTVVRDRESNEVLADLDDADASCIAAKGGRGGRGNARFVTARRQAPVFAELGEPGEIRELELELKLIADIGLIGLPNAGKSSLLKALTRANPAIGAYPFTTLQPNLGILVFEDGGRRTLADVPGMIEGAHEGVGLGIEFLRHVERTRILFHVVDLSEGSAAALEGISVIEAELAKYGHGLPEKPRAYVLNKTDIADPAEVESAREALSARKTIAISALTGEGIPALEDIARSLGPTLPEEKLPQAPQVRVYTLPPKIAGLSVLRNDDVFVVKGTEIEKKAAMTDRSNEEALDRFQRWIRAHGVEDLLRRNGCERGDTVRIGTMEFIYIPEDDDDEQ